MNKSSEFQTGRFVLLAATSMCAGLAISILLPIFGQHQLSPRKRATPQAASVRHKHSQPYQEFYPAVQSLTPMLTAHRPADSAREPVDSTLRSLPAPAVAQSMGISNARRVPTIRPQQAVPRRESSSARHSENRRSTLSQTTVQPRTIRQSNSRQADPSHPGTREYSGRVSTAAAPRPRSEGAASSGTSVYSPVTVHPVTVHPVTVNIDSEVVASQLEVMTERLEKLLESKELERQKVELTETQAQEPGPRRGQRRARQSPDSWLQTRQLADLNQSLRDIASAFERLRTETQQTANDISHEGRRNEIAYEELRSLQRQLAAQMKRSRSPSVSPVTVEVTPLLQAPITLPESRVGIATFDSRYTAAEQPVPATAAVAAADTRATNAAVAVVNNPPGDNFPVTPAVADQNRPIADAVARTDVLPPASNVADSELSPAASTAEKRPQVVLPAQDTPDAVAISNALPPQPTTNLESALLRAYKARKLMREAEQALEAGDTAVARTRAMQARNIAISRSHSEHPADHRQPGEPMTADRTSLPATRQTSADETARGELPDPAYRQQQARELVARARAALNEGDLRQATDLASRAHALHVSYEPREDCPLQLRKDIAQLTAPHTPTSLADPPQSRHASTGTPTQLQDQDPVEAVRTARIPQQLSPVPVPQPELNNTRKVVKPVRFENVYRFELSDVSPAVATNAVPVTPTPAASITPEPAESVTPKTAASIRPNAASAVCQQCGKVHAHGTPHPQQPVAPAETAPASPKKKLFAPHGARRSNRRIPTETEQPTTTDTVRSTTAPAKTLRDQPLPLHRLSSALRRLGKPATE